MATRVLRRHRVASEDPGTGRTFAIHHEIDPPTGGRFGTANVVLPSPPNIVPVNAYSAWCC